MPLTAQHFPPITGPWENHCFKRESGLCPLKCAVFITVPSLSDWPETSAPASLCELEHKQEGWARRGLPSGSFSGLPRNAAVCRAQNRTARAELLQMHYCCWLPVFMLRCRMLLSPFLSSAAESVVITASGAGRAPCPTARASTGLM